MPFFYILFDFYLFFRVIFYLQNHEKEVLLPVGADVARGTNSGCDAELRPRGNAKVARAGGAQGAAKWHGGHGATWAPVWGATCRFVNREDNDN